MQPFLNHIDRNHNKVILEVFQLDWFHGQLLLVDNWEKVVGLGELFEVFLVFHEFSELVELDMWRWGVLLWEEWRCDNFVGLGSIVNAIEIKITVLLCVLQVSLPFLLLPALLLALTHGLIPQRILLPQTLIQLIFDHQPTLIPQLLVVNVPQSVNVLQNLHEIVEFLCWESFKLIPEKAVKHFGEGFGCRSGKQAGEKKEGNVAC